VQIKAASFFFYEPNYSVSSALSKCLQLFGKPYSSMRVPLNNTLMGHIFHAISIQVAKRHSRRKNIKEEKLTS
jgi:hypothetical protein